MKASPEGPALGLDRGREAPPSSRALVPIATRDTDATPFATILDALIQRVPGAEAAALVDSQGETVDYAGRGEPFDLRVAAAHVQIILAGIDRFAALGEPRWVVIRGERKSVAASVLPDGYVLMLLLRPRAAFAISTRALKVCTRALAEEAGWTDLAKRDGVKQRSWFEVAVETDGRGRPSRVGGAKIAVEVLGAVMGLSVRERGFRVRTADGSELTLVREPRQRWYADEPV
ncbi:MAG: roadblock/LC7 domain-containing protein [Labilithrix sp.]|nr:roadblock/LC7 domain-containing protein [Labilithrix sp.]MBX3220377.1 roadblock/LC7 domain-containing protein [Labilithrix sp.]